MKTRVKEQSEKDKKKNTKSIRHEIQRARRACKIREKKTQDCARDNLIQLVFQICCLDFN